MQYRVHYCIENDRLTTEIEAASPHEAVVKFRHTRPDSETSGRRRSEVLSIMPVETHNPTSYA